MCAIVSIHERKPIKQTPQHVSKLQTINLVVYRAIDNRYVHMYIVKA